MSHIEICSPIGEGCIPVRAMEVVTYLDPDGNESVSVRWQGVGNIVAELGMLDYAKEVLTEQRRAENGGRI